MRRRRYLLFAFTCMTCALFGSPPTSAQISRRLDRCLAYPTAADDIDDRREEVRAKVAATEGVPTPAQTVVMDEAKLDGPTHLPDATRKRPLAGLKRALLKPTLHGGEMCGKFRFEAPGQTRDFSRCNQLGEHRS